MKTNRSHCRHCQAGGCDQATALTCVVRDITDHVEIIRRWLKATRMYLNPGNNVDDMSRAYGYITATSPQASTMPSAGDFDTGVRVGIRLPLRCVSTGHMKLNGSMTRSMASICRSKSPQTPGTISRLDTRTCSACSRKRKDLLCFFDSSMSQGWH